VRGKTLGGGVDEDSFSIRMRGVQVVRWESNVGSHGSNNACGG
jgi:hypothetical protein